MSRLLSFTTIAAAAALFLGATPASSHAQHAHPHSKAAHVDSTPKPAPKGTPADTAKADSIYTCPMDPEVVSKTPARCPKCGMKLVKKAVTKQAPKDSTKSPKEVTHNHAACDACDGCTDCGDCCDNGACDDCGTCSTNANSTQ